MTLQQGIPTAQKFTPAQELQHVEDHLAHLNKEDPCYYEEYENFASIKVMLEDEVGRVALDGVEVGE